MKAYVLMAITDVDGGFGDAIETQEPIMVFLDKDKANEAVTKYSKPVVYGSPYDDLHMGELVAIELDLVQ